MALNSWVVDPAALIAFLLSEVLGGSGTGSVRFLLRAPAARPSDTLARQLPFSLLGLTSRVFLLFLFPFPIVKVLFLYFSIFHFKKRMRENSK